MAEKSAPIRTYDPEKLKLINENTKQLLKRYEMDMELRELSPKTQYGYMNDIQGWLIYVYDNQGNKSIKDITEDDITEFLYWCKKQGNNSRRIKRRMSSLSALYQFLRKKRIIRENPMELIDRPKKDTDVIVQTFLTQEQVDVLRQKLTEKINTATTKNMTHIALIMRLYVFFSLSTMARVNAISNVRWEQIDFEERTVNDVIEKEGYIVTLYFSNEVLDYLNELKDFREQNKIDDGGWVFPSPDKKSGVANATMVQWCKRIGGMIDVPTLHPHDFRHSGSQLMKLAGAPIEDISELLHHQGLDVTKKHYLREDKKKIQKARDMYGI